jgi:hypothetical protein
MARPRPWHRRFGPTARTVPQGVAEGLSRALCQTMATNATPRPGKPQDGSGASWPMGDTIASGSDATAATYRGPRVRRARRRPDGRGMRGPKRDVGPAAARGGTARRGPRRSGATNKRTPSASASANVRRRARPRPEVKGAGRCPARQSQALRVSGSRCSSGPLPRVAAAQRRGANAPRERRAVSERRPWAACGRACVAGAGSSDVVERLQSSNDSTRNSLLVLSR